MVNIFYPSAAVRREEKNETQKKNLYKILGKNGEIEAAKSGKIKRHMSERRARVIYIVAVLFRARSVERIGIGVIKVEKNSLVEAWQLLHCSTYR